MLAIGIFGRGHGPLLLNNTFRIMQFSESLHFVLICFYVNQCFSNEFRHRHSDHRRRH